MSLYTLSYKFAMLVDLSKAFDTANQGYLQEKGHHVRLRESYTFCVHFISIIYAIRCFLI